MEIRGKTIGGLSAVRVRDALRTFLDIKTTFFEDGELKHRPKAVTANFLAQELSLTASESANLLATLIGEAYIDKSKLTPTHHGMALVQAEDRDRLPLDDARRILNEFLDAVRKVNAKRGARVFIERVHVFGSYLAGKPTLGDIDLLIEAPLPDDCEPDDMDERDALTSEIKISDYLSFHDEFDLIAADAEKLLIYDRRNPI